MTYVINVWSQHNAFIVVLEFTGMVFCQLKTFFPFLHRDLKVSETFILFYLGRLLIKPRPFTKLRISLN